MAYYPSTLSYLDMRKKHLQQELRMVEQELVSDYKQLLSPANASASRSETFLRTASRAWFLVDGALAGYKVVRRIGGIASLFSSSKKRKR